jgi:hypothetical protein
VRVFFTFKIDLHQVLREALPRSLEGGPIGEGFVDAERAVNGEGSWLVLVG